MTTYHVIPVSRRLTGSTSAKDIADALNKQTVLGRRFVRTITDRKRTLLLFTRVTHYLIFSEEV